VTRGGAGASVLRHDVLMELMMMEFDQNHGESRFLFCCFDQQTVDEIEIKGRRMQVGGSSTVIY
jgi:hypothetical protein